MLGPLITLPLVSFDPAVVTVVETVNHMAPLLVEPIRLRFTDCGQVNAAYWPATNALVVCNETMAQPTGVLRFIVAHEMAHAVIHQRDVPFTGSEEVAADELAALTLLAWDDEYDVLLMGLYFHVHAQAEDPTDPHPGDERRAYTLMCLADGSEDQPEWPECRWELARALHTWGRLLDLPPP